jgi:hypothetical protein
MLKPFSRAWKAANRMNQVYLNDCTLLLDEGKNIWRPKWMVKLERPKDISVTRLLVEEAESLARELSTSRVEDKFRLSEQGPVDPGPPSKPTKLSKKEKRKQATPVSVPVDTKINCMVCKKAYGVKTGRCAFVSAHALKRSPRLVREGIKAGDQPVCNGCWPAYEARILG